MSETPEIWVVWPTVHPKLSVEMVQIWKSRGYNVAVLINPPHDVESIPGADIVLSQERWRGFPTGANVLCRAVPGDVVVVVGDDVFPDPIKTAQEIGSEFLERFSDTFGVMQPTGDKFACSDTCAVSPWIGRAFIEKIYDGAGPYWEGYFHYFSDEELQRVATKFNVFYQREDITQYHDHWQRSENPKRPKHLMEAKGKWRRDRRVFISRDKRGFHLEKYACPLPV